MSRWTITKCHLCGKKNYIRTRRTFVESRYINKATKIRNSNPQGWAIEYGGKSKGDEKNNARTWEWINFSKGSGWTSSIDSLLRPRGVYGESKQISERSTNGWNWSIEVSITSQHRLGSYSYNKSNQGKITRLIDWRRSCGIKGSSKEGWSSIQKVTFWTNQKLYQCFGCGIPCDKT